MKRKKGKKLSTKPLSEDCFGVEKRIHQCFSSVVIVVRCHSLSSDVIGIQLVASNPCLYRWPYWVLAALVGSCYPGCHSWWLYRCHPGCHPPGCIQSVPLLCRWPCLRWWQQQSNQAWPVTGCCRTALQCRSLGREDRSKIEGKKNTIHRKEEKNI